MIKTIEDVEALFNGQRGEGDQFSLDRIQRLLEALDHPEADLRFVHIAGTNGKGSTSAFIESVLRHSNYRTGAFNSPQLASINEVMRIDNQPIADGRLIDLAQRVYAAAENIESTMDERVFPFELQVATMLTYFKEEAVDIVVLETGLGGEYDATNVVQNTEVAVISHIGLDHQQVLGDDLASISRHKAGITKEDSILVTYPGPREVEAVYEDVASTRGAEWRPVSFDSLVVESSTVEGQIFSYKDFKDLEISLLGLYQIRNATLALEALLALSDQGFDQINEASLRQGLKAATMPGRLELMDTDPVILLDGAHNPQGVESLKEALSRLFPGRKFSFIMGALKDKAYDHMVEEMEDLAQHFYFIQPKNKDRALDPKHLLSIVEDKDMEAEVIQTYSDLEAVLNDPANKNEIFVIYGSFYLVGPMRKYLIESGSED